MYLHLYVYSYVCVLGKGKTFFVHTFIAYRDHQKYRHLAFPLLWLYLSRLGSRQIAEGYVQEWPLAALFIKLRNWKQPNCP